MIVELLCRLRKPVLVLPQVVRHMKLLMKHANVAEFDVTVVLTTNATIRKHNKYYRDVDKPTDVLSIPLNPRLRAGEKPRPLNGHIYHLGDIFISLEYIKKQCAKERVEYEYRITQVLAHGLLHLLGYDHHTRPEYRQMRRMENRLIAAVDAEERKLGVIPASDPNFVSYPPMPDDDLDAVTDDTTVDSKRR